MSSAGNRFKLLFALRVMSVLTFLVISNTYGNYDEWGSAIESKYRLQRKLHRHLRSTGEKTKRLATVKEGGFYITFGAIFDISTPMKKHVLIESFDIHTKSETFVNVSVWTRQGSFGDNELFYEPEWNIVSSSRIIANGKGSLSHIPEEDFSPVYIEANSTQAFYITLTTLELICTRGNAFLPGKKWIENEDIVFTTGLAIDHYPFRKSNHLQAIWNGVIQYKLTSSRLSPSSYSHLEYPTARPSELNHPSPSDILVEETFPTSNITVESPFDDSQCYVDNQIVSTDYSLESENFNYGNMFVIRTKHDSVVITSFGILVNTLGPFFFEIYTKTGSYYGFEYESDAWTKVSSGHIFGQGVSQITTIPKNLVTPVTIRSNSNQAFYISINIDALAYENGMREGSAYTYNKYMDILEGNIVTSFSFSGGKIGRPVRWQGIVHFDVSISCSKYINSAKFTPSPTPMKVKYEEGNGNTKMELPGSTSHTSFSPSNEVYDVKEHVTTETVLKAALTHGRSESPSEIIDNIKFNMRENMQVLLMKNKTNLHRGSTYGTFFVEEIHGEFMSSIENTAQVQGCTELSQETSCSAVRLFISISHDDNISDDAVRFQVLSSAIKVLQDLPYPTTFIGPWPISDEIKLKIFVESTTQIKQSKVLRIIEHSVKNFLVEHVSQVASSYVTITETNAEDMEEIKGLVIGGNKRTRKHKKESEEYEYFTSEVRIKVFGLSRVQVNFTKMLQSIFNIYSDRFENMLKTNSGSVISKVIVYTSKKEKTQQEDFFDLLQKTSKDFLRERSSAGKLTIMFFIEALVLFSLAYICHKIRKERKSFSEGHKGFNFTLRGPLQIFSKRKLHECKKSIDES